MNYKAFTVSNPGKVRSIIIPVIVQQAESLCKTYNLTPSPIVVYALLDTGAETTCIRKSLADKLGLKVVDQCRIEAAGGIYVSSVYAIDLRLRNDVSVIDIAAPEFIGDKIFDIILGMDILTLGDLAITNAEERTVTSFRVPPGIEHIDFVAKPE